MAVPGALDVPTDVPSPRLNAKVRSFWKYTYSDGRSAARELWTPSAPARTSKPKHACILVRTTSSRLRHLGERRNGHVPMLREPLPRGRKRTGPAEFERQTPHDCRVAVDVLIASVRGSRRSPALPGARTVNADRIRGGFINPSTTENGGHDP